MKKYRRYWLGLVGIVALAIFVLVKIFGQKEAGDYRMGIIAGDGLMMVNISFERGMVNTAGLTGEAEVWLPQGFDWYRVDRVRKLLDLENKRDLGPLIFYYNFGFLPDKILFLDNFLWDKNVTLVKSMGLISWLKFFYWREQMIFKDEEVAKELNRREWLLSEIMVRDFADSQFLNSNLRLLLFNTTDYEGLAEFLGNRLSWAGFSVMGTENSDEKVFKCKLVIGDKTDESLSWQSLLEIFNCETEKDTGLADYEVEIYIGEEWAQMINYSGYVGTF